KGEGVVGVQPRIGPGEEYNYTGGEVNERQMGTIQGHYEMIDEHGDAITIDIPVFRLAVPTLIH
ncbi:ApaG domain, partial [Salmonella enterica]|uniref:ApaG domain-containing protein n=1 Tax=Salmonella enterica TaxID=28901 RepID=UPI00398C665C